MSSISTVLFISRGARFLINRNPRFHSRHTCRNLCSLKILRISSLISRMEKISGVGLNSGLSGSANGGGSSAGVSMMSKGGDDKHGVVQFELSPSSFLKIQKGDITKWFIDGSSDAIVNAANEKMLGGGGVDGAIHRAAGPELRAACYAVPEVRPGVRCPTGEARITLGFRLPVCRVIHTVGPIYDVDDHPEVSLRSAYRSCLRLAKEDSIQYIAFPALSCGVYGYPYEEAATIAIATAKEFKDDFKEVHFVLFSDDIYNAWLEKASSLL